MKRLCQIPASAAGQWWKLGGMLNFLSMCAEDTDAIPPPQRSRMGGGPTFLFKTSDSHLVQRNREKKTNEKDFLRRLTVAETNWGVDQGRQLYCLIHPAVWWRGSGTQKGWVVVVVPRRRWNLEPFCFRQFLTNIVSLCVLLLLHKLLITSKLLRENKIHLTHTYRYRRTFFF